MQAGFLEEAVVVVENVAVQVLDKLPGGRECFVIGDAIAGQASDFGPFDIGRAETALAGGEFLVIGWKFGLGPVG